jgi:catechol 2,3-dioxygenase-like lactoylglutathione lyase family enzyme
MRVRFLQDRARGRRDDPGMEQRISLITLGVADLQRSMDFYAALGWAGRSPDGDVAFYQAGGMVLGLWDRAKLAGDSAVEDGGGWGGVTLAHNVRSEAEVDAVLAEAAAAGARIVRPAAATFWGGYSGVFLDPDGHPWEVAWGPGWTIADDGSMSMAAE